MIGSPYLTIGDVAKRFGCAPWQVRRLIERNLLSEPPRIGAYRVFLVADFPKIEAALRQAGCLPESAEVTHGS